MLARAGTSWGANSWCVPWRARKAMGVGVPVLGEGCSKTVMREAGRPQGVVGKREATAWKLGREERPVPPITATRTGAGCVRG